MLNDKIYKYTIDSCYFTLIHKAFTDVIINVKMCMWKFPITKNNKFCTDHY